MPQLSTPTVWIVDDDEDDQLFISSAFLNGEPPITVLSLSDGEELLPQLADCTELPRLILLDVNMPRKNGFETLEELRSVPEFAQLPVVMLTTSSDEETGCARWPWEPITFLPSPSPTSSCESWPRN